jgi:hypothetical protein
MPPNTKVCCCNSAERVYHESVSCCLCLQHQGRIEWTIDGARSCRPDKLSLLDLIGARECVMPGGPVCTAEVHHHGKNCVGRLTNGTKQLYPDSNTEQHAWIKWVHGQGVQIHAWTVRNEVRPLLACC